MVKLNIGAWVRKYRFVLLVLLAGMVLMLLPTGPSQQAAPATREQAPEGLEVQLERILSQISGAGEVAVMLTEDSAEEIVYQTDGDGRDTVLVTDASRNEQGLVRTREPPVYRGAIVVCSGADNAAVRLAITEAVASVTGLGMDRIIVLKME